MGAADVIPGVSGGTIAFLMGIYQTLIDSIKAITINFRLLLKGRIGAFLKAINAKFLCSLILGILISIFSLARLMEYLLIHHPIELWSFFFGLIFLSSFMVLREIDKWNCTNILFLIIGIVVAGYICLISPSQTHSANIRFAIPGKRNYPDTDAMILDNDEQAVFLNFADCTPVILYDKKQQTAAIAHAGWRGTEQKIVPKTVAAMNSKPEDIVAVIGPAICMSCFKVGKEVFNLLKATVEDFEDQARMNEIIAYLNHYLEDHAKNYNIHEAENYNVELKYNPENAKYSIQLNLNEEEHVIVNSNIIKSSEYKRLKTAYPLIRDFLIEEEDYLILETDTEKYEIKSFEKLQKLIDERGQKGLTIQRFKGLGEMMPQQLWETTMDPATRTLLKVDIEDAMLCDQLFDILMGDKVDPRRNFIETNAVYATNIDT